MCELKAVRRPTGLPVGWRAAMYNVRLLASRTNALVPKKKKCLVGERACGTRSFYLQEEREDMRASDRNIGVS